MDNKLPKDITEMLRTVAILRDKINNLSIEEKREIYSKLNRFYRNGLIKVFPTEFGTAVLQEDPVSKLENVENPWDLVFKSKAWLGLAASSSYGTHPVLLGPSVNISYRNSSDRESKPSMWLLAVDYEGDYEGDLRYCNDVFYKCLQPYYEDKSDKTKIFFKSGLILGVEDILRPTNCYTVNDVQELFTYEQEQLKLWYSFYEKSRFKLKTLEPPNIIGFKGAVDDITDVNPICGLNITAPDGIKEQYVFKNQSFRGKATPSFDEHDQITEWKL